MPHVIIEGPDNSGKSGLARYLADEFRLYIVGSEGPEKYPGEVNERIRRYNLLRSSPSIIFDRHPCVSQPIYSAHNKTSPVEDVLIRRFYDSAPLCIFCVPMRDLTGHKLKAHDTPEHIEVIEQNAEAINEAYQQWAIFNARIWYRVGYDPMSSIADLIKGVLS